MTVDSKDRVVYIEPNAEVSLNNAYEVEGGTVMKSPDLEDFCIVVDLDVEVKGRTFYYSSTASQDNIRMEAVESASGQKVRFMEGSRIYLDKTHTNYINSLTTNYTDCTLIDVENGGTSEMFGIKSIDISYNNFMIPEVTIQFIDVRGVSLFAQEEMRHNQVHNGMSGLANNSIEGSFFKCFFTFPYPKFTLRVKGFYGQMVSYELTCSDFRAAFDSESGNFNVTTKFIGYAFSFLNDVMTNALLAAPYSEYIGAKYWDDNVANGRFKVTDKNGSPADMVKLANICKRYKSLKQQAEQEIKDKGLDAIMEQYNIGTPEQREAAKTYDIANIQNTYKSWISELNKCVINTDDLQSVTVTSSKDNSVVIITDDGHNAIMSNDGKVAKLHELVTSFATADTAIRQDENGKHVKALQDWLSRHKFELKEYESWDAIKSSQDESGTKVNPSIISDTELRTAVEKKAAAGGSEAWLKNLNSYIFIYEDFGLKTILENGGKTEVAPETQQQAEEREKNCKEAETRLIQDNFEKIFTFTPTIENITKIIMAHFETYTQMIGTCAKNILTAGNNRSCDKLGVSLDNFDDINIDTTKASGINIPPFPSVTKVVTDNDGNEKREDEWIGNYASDKSAFEEIALVEGLLKGIESAATDISCALETGNDSSGDTANTKTSISNPICVADLLMYGKDNPFGSPDMKDANSVFAHIALRGYGVLCNLNNTSVNASDLGKLDAENFISKFQSDTDAIKTALKGNVTGDSLWKYLSTGKMSLAPNKTAKSNPWGSTGQLFTISKSDPGSCASRMSVVMEDGITKELFPFKNWSFAKLKKATGGDNHKLCSSNIDSFIGTPCTNEGPMIKYTPIVCGYKKVTYLNNSFNSIASSSYGHSDIDNEFASYKFDASEFKSAYLSDSETVKGSIVDPSYSVSNKTYGYSTDYNKKTGAEAVEYNEDGSVSNLSTLNKTFGNVFVDYNYYYEDKEERSLEHRAWYFLQNAFGTIHTNGLQDKLKQNSSNVLYMPKYVLLYLGAQYLHNKLSGPRPRITRTLIDEYRKWVSTGFTKIANGYELKFTNSSFADMSKKLSSANSKKAVLNVIKQCCSGNYNLFVENCDVSDRPKRVGQYYVPIIYNKCSQTMQDVLGDLLCVADICLLTRYNSLNNYPGLRLSTKGPVATTNQITAYLNGVIDGLRDKWAITAGTQDPNSASITISTDGDPDDIKIGVYNYIKMLYDKWIAADTDCSNYKMEVMFSNDKPTFHFIDAAYNKIGKSYYINLGTLVDMMVKSESQNGYTMLTMVSELYASNKMLFLCLQNFADLAKSDMMEQMFKPVPYIEMKEPSNHSDFVVIYPGEPSSKLDVPESDYKDDGFYLNQDSSTWPTMISSKSGGYPIPAFGVSYGQQYQNYFKNIQVDMNTPMVTEQSIKAKFLIAGGSTGDENDGPRQVPIGQDLYTIYSNNSYTCTVTMMGCAWVQPMMYFVLLNVPMFRGSYQIVKVNHQIQAGNMTTTFTGVRMSRTSTRAVKQFIYGKTNDSSGAGVGSIEQQREAAANIGNNCEYAYYSPEGGGNGTDFSNELNRSLKSCLPSKAINIDTYDGGYYKNWTVKQALAAIALQEFNGMTQDAINQRIAVIACMYNWRGILKENAYKTCIFNTSGWNYFVTKSASRLALLKTAASNAKNWAKAQEEVYNVFKNGPYQYLVKKKNVYTNGEITLEQIQKGLHTVGTSDGANMQNLIDTWGSIQYELPKVGIYRHIITGDKGHTNGYVPPVVTSESKKKKNSTATLMSGFTNSIQLSLNATDAYKTAKVSAQYNTNGQIIQLTATGNNAINAMFDCIQSRYTDWWDKLYWCVGNGNADNDATSVIVHFVPGGSKTKHGHDIWVCKSYNIKNGGQVNYVHLKTEKDVNKSLKLCMIKYFKNNSIKDVIPAKAAFKSIVKMADITAQTLFEIGNTSGTSAVQDCNSVLGGVNTGAIPNVIKNGKSFNRSAASQWIENNSSNTSKHQCAKYVRSAIEAGGISTTGRPTAAYKYINFLPKIGFGYLTALTGKKAQKEWTTTNAQVGDIAVMEHGTYGHICMYTHNNRWVSDFKQNSMWVYGGNGGTCYIFRF